MINNATLDELTLLVIKLLKDEKQAEFSNITSELQPYDLAIIYQSLPNKYHARCLLFMSEKQIIGMFARFTTAEKLEVVETLGIVQSGIIMNMMANNDLAQLLDDIPQERLQEIFSKINNEKSQIVQEVLNYPPESAGRLMTNRFVWIKENYTVAETVEKLRSFAEYTESINYLYVVNKKKKLVGVVSYRDLLIAKSEEVISELMYSRVISVPVTLDQEKVAQIIERYKFVAIPVVENDTLVGIITVDDIIDVVIKEATEDIEKLSASGKAIDFDTGAKIATARRLPWLIMLMLIGIVSGSIISWFEATLTEVVALAFFMPMIAGMTGNTGTQSLAVVVRGLTFRDITKRIAYKVIAREFKVGIMLGVVCGLAIFGIAFFWQGNVILGVIVGLSLFLTLILGTILGTVVPIFLYKLKVDPAIASGPLITTINDIVSLLIYFGIATILMSHLK